MKKSVYEMVLLASCALVLNGSQGTELRIAQQPAQKNLHTQVRLPALPETLAGSLKRQEYNTLKGRYQIGLGRTFDQPITLSSASSNEWVTTSNGARVWSAQVTSEGALGARLHIENLSLPAGASLRVYDPTNSNAGSHVITSQDVPPERDLWTETVFSQDVVLECSVPAGVDPALVSFRITELSHIFQMPVLQPNLKEGTCHNDVTCFPAYATEASGVARITFIDSGNSYLCTGCLLSSSANPGTDYFLTAHHCIPSQTLASTMECFWFYQTSTCNGTPPSIDSVPHTSGGGDLLATAVGSDFTFLRLKQAPPGGAAHLSWSTAAPGTGEALVGIHHPTGSYKRISFGKFFDSDDSFWAVQWSSGVTEPGSSGSPLLNANHQVIGQLNGGFNGPGSSCPNPTAPDQYGRFDVSYQSLKQWLGNDPGGDTNNFLPPKGIYNGLFADSSNGVSSGSSGFLTLSVNVKGRFSGHLQIGAARTSFSGQFDGTGNAQLNVRHGIFHTFSIGLQLDASAGEDRIIGTVSDGNFEADLVANRAAYDGRTTFSPEAGHYTITIPGDHSSADNPGGDSVGTVTVDKAGRVRLKGFLADGTALSQATAISSNGEWPLYVSLYGGRGFLFGWISFGSDSNSVGGSVTWVKQQTTKSKFYKSGFTLASGLTGSPYVRPVPGGSILSLSDGTAAFQGGDLSDSITNDFSLSFNNRVLNFGGARMTLTFSAGTGLFSGRLTDPSSFRQFPFRGVVLQNQNDGVGYFTGTSQTGEVTIAPVDPNADTTQSP
jgi:trypsin-like peptidase